ncbi:uncharacterized protein C8Q71DRAFT_853218 [Rhodofomes roseus]|uniref:Uncharacterized protein n=1 Tax=Rhodofomes roseus TaxID=34475 RepID=A0ABQ8KUD3_9APHY|nr:uncharacterized protein C8Q71DRAFT_853218 [Rhodofomes roseus]KAH9842688.1 hypothetical protein C8Q71DRAFT_853218 [Rhodofomes roseus]
MTIALDGEVVGHYSHVSAANSDTYNYNVTIYNNTGLANTQHLLQMTAMQDSQASVILFDWAEYTIPYYFDSGSVYIHPSDRFGNVLVEAWNHYFHQQPCIVECL